MAKIRLQLHFRSYFHRQTHVPTSRWRRLILTLVAPLKSYRPLPDPPYRRHSSACVIFAKSSIHPPREGGCTLVIHSGR